MLDGSANRICNIMRANECFATGQSIQRTYGLYFIHETPDTGASAPTQPMKITRCRTRYVSKWSYIRVRAITCLPAMHWNILNANGHVWKNELLWVTRNIIPRLVNRCSVLQSWCSMRIMHTRPESQTPCWSLQKGACVPQNLNRKDRWGEGQLAFINHSSARGEELDEQLMGTEIKRRDGGMKLGLMVASVTWQKMHNRLFVFVSKSSWSTMTSSSLFHFSPWEMLSLSPSCIFLNTLLSTVLGQSNLA